MIIESVIPVLAAFYIKNGLSRTDSVFLTHQQGGRITSHDSLYFLAYMVIVSGKVELSLSSSLFLNPVTVRKRFNIGQHSQKD